MWLKGREVVAAVVVEGVHQEEEPLPATAEQQAAPGAPLFINHHLSWLLLFCLL